MGDKVGGGGSFPLKTPKCFNITFLFGAARAPPADWVGRRNGLMTLGIRSPEHGLGKPDSDFSEIGVESTAVSRTSWRSFQRKTLSCESLQAARSLELVLLQRQRETQWPWNMKNEEAVPWKRRKIRCEIDGNQDGGAAGWPDGSRRLWDTLRHIRQTPM